MSCKRGTHDSAKIILFLCCFWALQIIYRLMCDWSLTMQKMLCLNNFLEQYLLQSSLRLNQSCSIGYHYCFSFNKKNYSSFNFFFQARWRGYFTRRQIELEVGRRLSEVRHKVEEARKNATEENKLCNRWNLESFIQTTVYL